MQLPVPVKVGAFALLVMGSYTWYANSIPQIESRPPEELSLEGNATPQQLVTAGELDFPRQGAVHDLPRHRPRRSRAGPRGRRRAGGRAASPA